jgi:hypothetical protein
MTSNSSQMAVAPASTPPEILLFLHRNRSAAESMITITSEQSPKKQLGTMLTASLANKQRISGFKGNTCYKLPHKHIRTKPQINNWEQCSLANKQRIPGFKGAACHRLPSELLLLAYRITPEATVTSSIESPDHLLLA